MKLFVNFDEDGSTIKNADEFGKAVKKFYALTHREMAIKDLPHIEARLNAWTEIMHEAGFNNFDARKLYAANIALGKNIYVQASLFGNKSLTEHESSLYKIYSFESEKQGLPADTQFGFIAVMRDIRSGSDRMLSQEWNEEVAKNDNITFELYAISTIPDEVWNSLEEEGLLDEAASTINSLFDFGSHDFLHTCTSFTLNRNEGKTLDLLKGLHPNGPHTDDKNYGYENFLILLNQRIFCKLRETDSVWFETLVSETKQLAKLIGEIQDDQSKEAIQALGVAHLCNYVPKDLLLATAPEKWEEVLRTAQPQIADDRIKFDGEPCRLEEISMKFYNAAKQDYHAASIKQKDAVLAPSNSI